MTPEEPLDMLISAVAILGLIILVISTLWAIYQIADRAFLKEHSGEGTIIDKRSTRPHTSVTMQSHSTRYGNSWRFIISIGEHEGEISIGQGSIGQFRIGDQVLTTYSIGRLSGNIHLFSIEKQDKEQPS